MNDLPSFRLRALTFRVALVYWVLWGLAYALQQFARLTQTPGLAPTYWSLWHPVTRVVGTHVLGFPDPPVYTDAGSGDSPFQWALLVSQLGVALVVAAVWTLLRRSHDQDERRSSGLRSGLRFLLAVIMLEYGAAKLINVQFPTPRFEVLVTPFGQLAPENLLWAFMGASPLYVFVSGLAEMSAGALLLFRRTAVLGALLAMAVMANVLLLNLGYDVPVKLFAMHLVVAAMWIVAPRSRALAQALMPPAGSGSRKQRVIGVSVAMSFLLLVGGRSLELNAEGRRTFGGAAPRAPLAGIYVVEGLTAPDDSVAARWPFATLVVPRLGSRLAQARFPDGTVLRARLDVDTLHRNLILRRPGSREAGADSLGWLGYRFEGDDIHVDGEVGGVRTSARLGRVLAREMPVLRQRIRWVR